MKTLPTKLIFLLFLIVSATTNAQSILFNSSGGTPAPSALMELRSTEKGFLAPRMDESDRLGISSPAQGLLVFQVDGTVGFYFYNGASWDTLGGATTVTNITNVSTVSNSNIAIVRDTKASGTNGGNFTKDVWQVRDLIEYKGDSSFISVASNQITLDEGVYVFTISAPAFEVDLHQIRLFNVTGNLEVAVGTVAFSDKFTSSSSQLTAVVNVSAATETFEVQHQCSTTSPGDSGMGQGIIWGESVFTQVRIEKL